MRKVLFCILGVLLCLSCGKHTPDPDPADYFVGNYTFNETCYVVWGGVPESFTDQGTFTLSKIASDKVKMTGAWKTTGTIVGDTISFENCTFSDAKGYINYSFSTGTLAGNRLSFTYTGTGSSIKSNGRAYAWEQSGRVSATKSSK